MTVVHLAAECAPLAKVGGLGDVVGALPAALAAQGVASSVVMPLYGGPEGAVAERAGALRHVAEGEVRYGGAPFGYTVYRTDGPAPVYLVHQPEHFGEEGVYVRADGEPFARADDRFAVFQLAALDWLAGPASAPPDVLHVHDHHAGLVPALIANGPAYERLAGTPTVFTVHSADHQGEAPWAVWERVSVHVPEAEGLMVGDELNAMKAALSWADAVTAVSPTYADELGEGGPAAGDLAEAFRDARPKLTGIVNGIDTDVWDPATDPHLPATYSADDRAGKAETKRAVCEALGLDPARPLVAFVGRMEPEKGADLLAPTLRLLLAATDAAFAVLGTGDRALEDGLRTLAAEAPDDRLSLTLAYDEGLAHRLYAAADLFLMPSRSEPCGLGQLYAMAYGTPPVVHAVGGLRDTVTPWDGTTGTGIWVEALTPGALAAGVRRALAVVADGEAFARLQGNGFAVDSSWAASARAYADLYRSLGAT